VNQKNDIILAVVCAPWSVFLVVAASASTLGSPDGSALIQRLQWAAFAGFFAVAIAYALILVYGIPMFLLFRRLNIVGFWSFLFAGLAGPVPFVLNDDMKESLLAVFCGGLVAITAWFFVCWLPKRRSNPTLQGTRQTTARP
jgi:hypothetical protein